MGKKRKRGEAQEDQQQSDISEDNPRYDSRYYQRAMRKKVINKANERLVRDYKETRAPDTYKHHRNVKK